MEIIPNVERETQIQKIVHEVKHLALICDGNRRWATAQGMHPGSGHAYSFTVLAPRLLSEIFDLGIHTITFWCASTRNKQRINEIANALNSIDIFIKKMILIAHEKHIRLVHLGRKDGVSASLRVTLEEAENITSHYEEHILNIALDYGGRDEIVRACQTIMKSNINPDHLTEEILGQAMDTKNQPYPDPDFIIRPAGEQKLSGFMPWQNLYSEYFFVSQPFPEVDIDLIKSALLEFGTRKRTFSK